MRFKWMPVIDADKCTGCNLCVEACGPKCLELVEGIAALPRPDECGSEEHCISVCRDDAIHMQWVPFTGNQSVGLWRSAPRAAAGTDKQTESVFLADSSQGLRSVTRLK